MAQDDENLPCEQEETLPRDNNVLRHDGIGAFQL